MDKNISIAYLQEYIKSKDHDPERKLIYFLKLSEEVGELAKVILEDPPSATETSIKGTIEEEIWDILYYLIAIANCYDIDIEKWIPVKEKLNNKRYNPGVVFEPPQK